MTTFREMIDQVETFQNAMNKVRAEHPQVPQHSDEVRTTLRSLGEHLYNLEKLLKKDCIAFDKDPTLLRMSCLIGELAEMADALEKQDTVGVFDALLDVQYFLLGAFNQYGMWQIARDGFQEVHRSNMTKLGQDGKLPLDSSGRAIKNENYEEPDLFQIVNDNIDAAIEVSKII